jgi:2,3-bisphosphoglycerate-dependent phosphoglycerate mutase
MRAKIIPLFQAVFYFLRHGETDVNRLGLVAGRSDVELNETGWRQARAAAQRLKTHRIDAIYSSPLKRARDTASCIASALGLEMVIVPDLAERNWGELEGKPREMRVAGVTPRGAEEPEVFCRRTAAGLGKIRGGAVPLIVAHSGTFRVLCNELDVPAGETTVENSLPLRFIPPSESEGKWRMEMV